MNRISAKSCIFEPKKLKYRGGTLVDSVRLYRHKFARIPNRNLAVEVKESIAYAYAMPMA